jgi:hypothetical protein
MKSSTAHKLQLALIREAMLAVVFTVGLLPVSSATSHFSSTKVSCLSGPAADVLCPRCVTLGPRIYRRPGISATTPETVTHASIMWGSFAPQNPTPNTGGEAGGSDPSKVAERALVTCRKQR